MTDTETFQAPSPAELVQIAQRARRIGPSDRGLRFAYLIGDDLTANLSSAAADAVMALFMAAILRRDGDSDERRTAEIVAEYIDEATKRLAEARAALDLPATKGVV